MTFSPIFDVSVRHYGVNMDENGKKFTYVRSSLLLMVLSVRGALS